MDKAVGQERDVEHETDVMVDGDEGVSRRRALGLAGGAAGLAVAGAVLPALPAGAAVRKPAPPPPPRIGILEIPKLGVAMWAVDGLQKAALDAGPSHWPGTPIPGQLGNSVFMGHRVSKHRVFRNIDKLVAGDVIRFYVAIYNINTTYEYQVTGAYLADPRRDVGRVLAQSLEKTMTLFACHPPGSVRQRYVVTSSIINPA